MSLPNILVCDDHPSICKEVAMFLKGSYTVHAFKSGKEALDYLEKNSIDLILLDYYMPEMTGFEVLLQIQKSERHNGVPVIFLTSEINERLEHEMRRRGASEYLVKPVNSATLQSCIRKLLN
ncbi:MAG: response regulator [Defluviitaleaceae bacterium]|nr:response regulator [Defluviitaleaceae bacterium]